MSFSDLESTTITSPELDECVNDVTKPVSHDEYGFTVNAPSPGLGVGVGVGVGIGFPLGGGSGPAVTEVLEILTGTGEKPDRPNAYDARSVDINLRGTVTE